MNQTIEMEWNEVKSNWNVFLSCICSWIFSFGERKKWFNNLFNIIKLSFMNMNIIFALCCLLYHNKDIEKKNKTKITDWKNEIIVMMLMGISSWNWELQTCIWTEQTATTETTRITTNTQTHLMWCNCLCGFMKKWLYHHHLNLFNNKWTFNWLTFMIVHRKIIVL